jgi:hypothetical protein
MSVSVCPCVREQARVCALGVGPVWVGVDALCGTPDFTYLVGLLRLCAAICLGSPKKTTMEVCEGHCWLVRAARDGAWGRGAEQPATVAQRWGKGLREGCARLALSHGGDAARAGLRAGRRGGCCRGGNSASPARNVA